jgi:hypothetical protein
MKVDVSIVDNVIVLSFLSIFRRQFVANVRRRDYPCFWMVAVRVADARCAMKIFWSSLLIVDVLIVFDGSGWNERREDH